MVTKTYAPLLRKFASGRARTAEANQIQCELVHFFFPLELVGSEMHCAMSLT